MPHGSTQSLADYRWLVSPDGRALFGRAPRPSPTSLPGQRRLRADLTADRARPRRRTSRPAGAGSQKIRQTPERLFFTPVGLEQATDGWTAAYKAGRFPAGGRVIDFCCGIGGDLMALAARGPAHGVDRDPVAALFAEANCRALAQTLRSRPARQGPAVTVSVGEVASSRLSADDFWHIDPDRRATGRRTTHVELHDPPAEVIDDLLAAAPAGAVKLAPAADIPDSLARAGRIGVDQLGARVPATGRLVRAAGRASRPPSGHARSARRPVERASRAGEHRRPARRRVSGRPGGRPLRFRSRSGRRGGRGWWGRGRTSMRWPPWLPAGLI